MTDGTASGADVAKALAGWPRCECGAWADELSIAYVKALQELRPRGRQPFADGHRCSECRPLWTYENAVEVWPDSVAGLAASVAIKECRGDAASETPATSARSIDPDSTQVHLELSRAFIQGGNKPLMGR